MHVAAFSFFAIRWRTVANREKPFGERAFSAVELICGPVSFTTIGYLAAEVVLRRCFGSDLLTPMEDRLFARWILPILTAAAIGYFTNWLAIKMLFEPYEPTLRHWIPWCTFGFWRQGLLPKNKGKMAHELGQTFGARLLKPDKLVAELSDKAEAYLARPEVAAKFKAEAQTLFKDNAEAIAAFIVPEIERAAGDMLEGLLTPEKIGAFWDGTIAPRLQSESTRALIAEKLIEVVRANAPELAEVIQRELVAHIGQAIREMPGIGPFATMFDIEGRIARKVASFFADEDSIRGKFTEWLQRPETIDMLKDKLVLLGEKATEWLRSSDGQAAVGGFAAELKGKASAALSAYVKEAIPKLVGEALGSPKLWSWVEGAALPGLRKRLADYIAEHGDEMLASFDLPGRIEKEVNALSMPDFHAMLDRLMAQHLGAIQVLGYVLGAIVGALQLL